MPLSLSVPGLKCLLSAFAEVSTPLFASHLQDQDHVCDSDPRL